DLYRMVIERCDDAHVRLASIQKASLLLTESRVDTLLAAEQGRSRTAEEERALAVFRAERGRARTLQALADGRPVPADALRALAEAAEAGRDAGLAGALGWAYHRQEEWSTAAQWFERALAWRPDP